MIFVRKELRHRKNVEDLRIKKQYARHFVTYEISVTVSCKFVSEVRRKLICLI